MQKLVFVEYILSIFHYYRSCFGATYTKIGTIQRRLAWPLRKDDTQIREAFHIFHQDFRNVRMIMKNASHIDCQRPYHLENTRTRLISEVKQG